MEDDSDSEESEDDAPVNARGTPLPLPDSKPPPPRTLNLLVLHSITPSSLSSDMNAVSLMTHHEI